MSNGENERALEVFQLIYSINYGKPKNEYPVNYYNYNFVSNNNSIKP